MYHSIAPRDLDDFVDPPNRLPPSRFAEQMGFLRDRRRVVSLSQLVDEVASGTTPPAGTVCITFDDGYLDSLTVAAPILTELRLPATLYLATGYIERQQPQWADALHWLIRRRTAHRLSLPWLPTLDMRHAMSRNTARAVLHQHLLEATEDERAMLLGEVQRQLEPAGSIARTTLTWDEVRRMRQCHPLIEIGGHTRDHVDLRSNRGERAQAQISRCADDLRRELGTTPTHFSYPYARWCDETRNFVRTAGWRSAVGMGDTFRITAASNRFAMPRVEAPRTMTELRFKTSGAYPGALAILGIRAGSSDESASATVGLG
jgi:peptidoglycan/xylan/chitin deacetylase (PgdA/CDA1 family)